MTYTVRGPDNAEYDVEEVLKLFVGRTIGSAGLMEMENEEGMFACLRFAEGGEIRIRLNPGDRFWAYLPPPH